MSIRDHGKWTPYKPDELPQAAPPGALFCKRESDGQDWYDYVNPGTNFEETSVKFAALWQEALGGYIVGAAVYDATMLFPANQVIGEILDYAGNDPQTEFGNKLYDLSAGTFAVPKEPAPVPSEFETKVLSALDNIVGRLEKLEKSK
jgi:hypothetical protein